MQIFRNLLPCALLATFMLPAASVAQAKSGAPVKAVVRPANYDGLVTLFSDWRAFERPTIENGMPDYSAAAMARKAAALPAYRERLKSIDTSSWSPAAQNDYKLVEAEMNGLDFMLRVLKPWARDPGFYQTVFGEESDVPAHEGPSASPTIDLFKRRYPLSKSDDEQLTTLIGAVPAMLEAARINLAESNAADLWRYGDRAFKEQSEVLAALERGDLKMRTLEGERLATLSGASSGLRQAVSAARLRRTNLPHGSPLKHRARRVHRGSAKRITTGISPMSVSHPIHGISKLCCFSANLIVRWPRSGSKNCAIAIFR